MKFFAKKLSFQLGFSPLVCGSVFGLKLVADTPDGS